MKGTTIVLVAILLGAIALIIGLAIRALIAISKLWPGEDLQ